ncbi:hypothetical protein J2T55_002487 [Methylohalomonas lacus]|uniref:DUF3108 domain-containing protein n=1 Tax=Methylohalomonas lacus TaxID=398773 RepID=A0AAE3L2F1_9GAMM|nr:DUF3108 domain-containing protein [Methylohalomonas lacus]MCS3904451.1 hypothetical protein [Methylohalomonas lacus]
MKTFLTRLLSGLSLMLAMAPGWADTTALPPLFEAEYTLYSKGFKVATIKRLFKQQANGQYLYESYSETKGVLALFRDDEVIERSHWRLTDSGYEPLEYVYQHTGSKKNRNVHINFDWADNEVRMRVDNDNWEMALEPGTLDKMLYQLAMMRDLGNGISDIRYRVADGGKIKSYNFEIFGREPVETPYGNFEALKVERFRDDRERETLLWCVEKLGYLPVKIVHIEPDGLKTTAVLESYNRLDSDDSAVRIKNGQ